MKIICPVEIVDKPRSTALAKPRQRRLVVRYERCAENFLRMFKRASSPILLRYL